MHKRLIIIIIISVLFSSKLFSQSVSVSYFFPKDGYFANPIAPVNIGLPVGFGKYFKITPGIGMKNIGGMSMSGFPTDYNSDRALIGPFQSIEASLVPTIVIPMGDVGFDLMAGVFGFTTINSKIHHGNFNKMISEANNYRAVSTDINMDASRFGWGYIYGFRFNFKVASNIRAFFGADYYFGKQKIDFSGTHIAVNYDNAVIEGESSYTGTHLLFHGLNITVGVTIK